MQQEVAIEVGGLTIRGTEHMPTVGAAPVPAVVLFHGFTGDRQEAHRLFLKVSRFLEAQGIASFRFDFSGSGESDGSFADMTVSTELREAHAILDFARSREGVCADRITVCGLSLGGLIASLLAAERPADIERLVLIAPAGNFKQIVAEMMHAYRADLEHLRVFDYGGNPVGKAFAAEILALNPFHSAQGYEGPVLLLHGTADQRVPVSISERFLSEVYGDRGKLIQIEGANHTFDAIRYEDELMQAIHQFVRAGNSA